MLENFIKQAEKDLNLENEINSPEAGIFKISFNEEIVVDALLNLRGNYFFKGTIGECPKEKVEDFLLKIMEANLFGKGTYGAVIGLNDEEKILTLSLEVDYNSTYKEWKEKLQDFSTVLNFWKNESQNHH